LNIKEVNQMGSQKIFESMLIAKIISDLPIWILDSEWERVFLLFIIWIMGYVYLIGKNKRA
jgi:hypothetical protein